MRSAPEPGHAPAGDEGLSPSLLEWAYMDKKTRRLGASDVLPPHVIALIRERQRRLAAVPRFDQYIAQAAGHLTLQGFWRSLKRREEEDAQRLNVRIDREMADGE